MTLKKCQMLVVFTHAKVWSSLVSLWQYSIWLFETSNLVGCYTSSAALTCGIVGLFVPSPLAIFQTSLEAVENGMSSTSSRTSISMYVWKKVIFKKKAFLSPFLNWLEAIWSWWRRRGSDSNSWNLGGCMKWWSCLELLHKSFLTFEHAPWSVNSSQRLVKSQTPPPMKLIYLICLSSLIL